MIKIYLHPVTRRVYDYGTLLKTETGVAWSSTGNPDDAFGIEYGRTIEDARATFQGADGVEIVDGEPIERSHDMNPHGFI